MERNWEYHCTISWHKTNPSLQARLYTPVSSCEWIQVLKRLDEKGNSVKGIAFNWLGQANMHNFISGPRCQSPERLYWHDVDGEIVPCTRKGCSLCQQGMMRRSHPTQTPLYVFDWIFSRFTQPGMRIFDPYSGIGTTIMANYRSNFGLDITASESCEGYVKVHNLWLAGKWHIPPLADEVDQMELF